MIFVSVLQDLEAGGALPMPTLAVWLAVEPKINGTEACTSYLSQQFGKAVKSVEPLRPYPVGSKIQEINNVLRLAFGLKKGHVHLQ